MTYQTTQIHDNYYYGQTASELEADIDSLLRDPESFPAKEYANYFGCGQTLKAIWANMTNRLEEKKSHHDPR